MTYRFQFIGEPFSKESPGAICAFEEWDVAEIRRQAHNWMELDSSDKQEVQDRFFPKVRGQVAKQRPAKG